MLRVLDRRIGQCWEVTPWQNHHRDAESMPKASATCLRPQCDKSRGFGGRVPKNIQHLFVHSFTKLNLTNVYATYAEPKHAMPEIFSRNIQTTRYHPRVCQKLDDLNGSFNSADLAVFENVKIDDRVNDSGSVSFLDFSNTRIQPLTDDLRTYSGLPTLTRPGLTDPSNVVCQLGTPSSPALPGNTELVTVVKLFDPWVNNLHNWIGTQLNNPTAFSQSELDELQAPGNAQETLRGIASDSKPRAFSRWLELAVGRFGAIPRLVVRSLVETYEQVLRGQLGTSPVSPPDRLTWTGLWVEFEPLSRSGALTWLEVFGLGHHAYPDPFIGPSWFVVLKYKISDCVCLLRPTILEGGDNPWHFPYRASAPVANGGKTVIFGNSLHSGVAPLAEFVHTAIHIKPTHLWAVDSYLPTSRTGAAVRSELINARNVHRSRLPTI
jgi:hypothetical protein